MDTHALDEMVKKLQQVKPKLPAIAGNEMVNFALDNFRRQGFQGASFQPWKKRKSPTKWGSKPKRNGRALLILTSRLKRSVRVVRANWNIIAVGSDVPYAKVHNNGLRMGQIQQVASFKRVQTLAGVASKFKVKGEQFETGSAMSINSRKRTRNLKVKTEVTVKAHSRKIDQNIPARKFIGHSPYLTSRLQRVVGAQIIKALK